MQIEDIRICDDGKRAITITLWVIHVLYLSVGTDFPFSPWMQVTYQTCCLCQEQEVGNWERMMHCNTICHFSAQ